MISTSQKFDKKPHYFQIPVQSLALFSQKLCDICSFVSAISGTTFEGSIVWKCTGLDSTARMAPSVQKMEIFDKDFKQLFENNVTFYQTSDW